MLYNVSIMKRLRLIVRISTIALLILTLLGLVVLVFNQNLSPLDTAYEIIAFSVGMSGMIMAVVSQMDSVQQEKASKKMIRALTRLNREADADDKIDADFQKKLDLIIGQNAEIYRSIEEEQHLHQK